MENSEGVEKEFRNQESREKLKEIEQLLYYAEQLSTENLKKGCPITRQRGPLRDFTSASHQTKTRHEDRDCGATGLAPTQVTAILITMQMPSLQSILAMVTEA